MSKKIESKPFQIEVGQSYRARDGSGPWKITERLKNGSRCPFIARSKPDFRWTFRLDGQYGLNPGCSDLVALWEEEKPFKLDKNKKYRSRNGQGPWIYDRKQGNEWRYSLDKDLKIYFNPETGIDNIESKKYDLVAEWVEEKPEQEIKVGSIWRCGFKNEFEDKSGTLWEVVSTCDGPICPIKLISTGQKRPWFVSSDFIYEHFMPEPEMRGENQDAIIVDEFAAAPTCKDPCDGGWISGYGPRYRCPQCKPPKSEKKKKKLTAQTIEEWHEEIQNPLCTIKFIASDVNGDTATWNREQEYKIALARVEVYEEKLKPTRAKLIKQTWGL